jgi:hypothetical protein
MFGKLLRKCLWCYGRVAPLGAILSFFLVMGTWLPDLRDNAQYHMLVMAAAFITALAYFTQHEFRQEYKLQWTLPPIVLSYVWVFVGAFSILHLLRIWQK